MPTPKDIDAIFAEWNRTDSPGCALAVMKDGAVVYRHGYGMANLEYGVPVAPDTIFHVASVSKQFTDFAIVLLALEGKLSLADDVRKYLPWLPDFGQPITLRHLAHHTSGLRDQWELLVQAGWRMDDVITIADILRLFKRQRELNFEPGAEYTYCNTGYTLLAQVVEVVSGQSFASFCQERIFAPLGMTRTHVHDDHTRIVPGRAYSYSGSLEKGFKHEVLSYANNGATSLFTTVEDLARWDENFYTGAVGGQAAITMMHEPFKLNNGAEISYRLGLMEGRYRGLRTVEHSGADAGFRTVILRFPEQHFSVAVLCNLGEMKPAVLARKVAELFLADNFTQALPAAVSGGTTLKPEQLMPLAGLYYNPDLGRSWKIEYADGKLKIGLGPGVELAPVSETRFGLVGFTGAELDFQDQGKTLVLKMGEQPERYHRVEPYRPDAAELAHYAGRYYSQELDVPYTVELRGDQLWLDLYRFGSVVLEPVQVDAFRLDLEAVLGEPFPYDLAFGCDARGQTSELFITSGRVRRSRFVKVG